jgi:two-component system sensor histidine kinase AlgZ
MVLAELLAIILALVGQPLTENGFQDLLYISLFVQWVALATVAALCLARPLLLRLPSTRGLFAAYGIMLAVALVVSELMVWVLFWTGTTSSPRPDWYLYYHLQNFTIAAIVDALALRYILARHLFRQSASAEARARMDILKYRIRPHFLFNSMNIIASLTHSDPAKAETAIEDMADLFRLMLDESKHLIPVASEIAVARKYLALETLRLDDRLRVKWNLDEMPRAAKVPVLMLQLMLENAIHYGIEPQPHGGEVTIDLHMAGDRMHIRIGNPETPVNDDEEHQGDNAAIRNVRQRLASHYGDAATLHTTVANGRFVVTIELPAFGGAE